MTISGHWETRLSSRGNRFQVWCRTDVPRIPQQYLDCTIYLYPSVEAAEAGEKFGGSGCLVSMPSESGEGFGPEHVYAVTNEHVAKHGSPVVRLNTIDGNSDILELREDDWVAHPQGDDLAAVPVELLPETLHRYYSISAYHFLRSEHLAAFGGFGAGDDTFMVGRFITHAGKQRNTPALRFGSIAMLPFEKIRLENGYMQEAFLVETRSISGYSGSPVFVYQPVKERIRPPRERPFDLHTPQFDLSSRQSRQETITELVGVPLLLGINRGHIREYPKVLDRMSKPISQGWKVESNTGMTIVIPAWRLLELLNTEDFVMSRKIKEYERLEEQEAEETVAADVERPEPLTRESYEDALKRASSRVSEPESKKTRTSE